MQYYLAQKEWVSFNDNYDDNSFLQSLDPLWRKEMPGKHLKSLRCKTRLSKEFDQTGYLIIMDQC